MPGGEFETPPASPSYSPQPSDDEEDGENTSVASDDSGGPGWWTDEAITQREREREDRVIHLANKAHIDLMSVLTEDNYPTLDAVLEYTEWVSLSNWPLFGSDVDALNRIMWNFVDRARSQDND